MNTYPLFIAEELAFKSKHNTLQSQGTVISSTLSGLEKLDAENVGKVMELLDIGNLSRCIVTDTAGLVLYDTENMDVGQGLFALFPGIVTALEGNDVFRSSFSDGAFQSSVAMPVMYRSETIGCVYLYEYDTTQAAVLIDVQSTLRSISLIVAASILFVSALLSRILTRRISRILAAIKIVHEGEYSHRMRIRGHDELAELGTEFNRLTDRLEKTEEMRRRFVSDASHELKTPLASIRLLTDSILQTESMPPETVREFVSDIGEEADRLSRMTAKLLSLTRMSDAPETRVEKTNLSDIVHSAAHMLKPLADSCHVVLVIREEPEAYIMADPDDIYQIVFNLIENGIKYNHPGGEVQVRILVYGSIVELLVDDNGIGIPSEDLPRIFERFYRVEKARSRESGGAGLGLSIVWDAVTKYNGTVTAGRSAIGGTSFSVKFPRCTEKEAEA